MASIVPSTAEVLRQMKLTRYEFLARKFTSNSFVGDVPFSSMTHSLLALEPDPALSWWAFDSPDSVGLFSFGKEKNYPKAIKRLSDFLEKNLNKKVPLPEEEDSGEFALHHFLAKFIIQPLCGNCFLSKHDHEKTAKEKRRDYTGLALKDLGMGEQDHTWHGSLDMMSKVICEPFRDHARTPVLVAESFTDSIESDEGFQRKEMLDDGLPQVTAQTLVYSMIHHQRLPDENPLVPGILFSDTSFTVVMYDCVHDILLQLNDDVKLINESRLFESVSVAFLWTVLHHVMFLNWPEKTANVESSYESGFLKLAYERHLSHHYENLSDYHKTFTGPKSTGRGAASFRATLPGITLRKRWPSRDDEESPPKKNRQD